MKITDKRNIAVYDIKNEIDTLIERIKENKFTLHRYFEMNDVIHQLTKIQKEVPTWAKPYTEKENAWRIFHVAKDAINSARRKKYISSKLSRKAFKDLLNLDEYTHRLLCDGTYHLTETPITEEDMKSLDMDVDKNKYRCVIIADAEGKQVNNIRWIEELSETSPNESYYSSFPTYVCKM